MRGPAAALKSDPSGGETGGALVALHELRLREGDELAAAVASRTANKIGARVMIIKGLSLEFHKLRGEHVSGDVDVYVEDRSRAEDLIAALAEHGWRRRPVVLGERRTTTHSATLIRSGWPNDIDVHWEYPGLPTVDGAVFDLLWSSRAAAQIAGLRCWVPDKASSIIIWALHSLRGAGRQPRHRLELMQLVNDVLIALDRYERVSLGSRIVELKADRALLEVPELAELIGDRASAIDEESWAYWRQKLAHGREASPWLQVLRDAPKWKWPWLAWRAAWPSAHDMRLLDEALVDTAVGRVQSRLRRVGRLANRIREHRATPRRRGL